MKKFNLLLTLALLVSIASASAQVVDMSFGLSAGSRMSKYSIEGISNSSLDNRTGFQAGASWSAKIAILEIGPEVIYSYHKMYLNDSSIYGDKADIKINSVDVPLVATLTILGPIKIEAGPSFSIFNKAKATLDNGEKVDIGRLKPSVGYTAGLKLVVLKVLTASIRYNGEFDRYSSNLGVEGGSDYKVDNHSFVVSVGARF